jgi:hypothetical protein
MMPPAPGTAKRWLPERVRLSEWLGVTRTKPLALRLMS